MSADIPWKMATIVRVKRKLTEEPTEKIVISCKRHKDSSSNHDQPHKEVFKLAGTVKSKVKMVQTSQSPARQQHLSSL